MKQIISLLLVCSSVVMYSTAAQLTPQQEWKRRQEEKVRQAAAAQVVTQQPPAVRIPQPPPGPKPPQSAGNIPVAPSLAPKPPIGLTPRDKKELEEKRAQEEKKRKEWRKVLEPEKPEKPGEPAKLRSGIMITPKTINQENAFVPCPPRGLAIILDDSEDTLEGPMTASLHSALYGKFSVLVSVSLMKNIFDRPVNQYLERDKAAIKKEVEANADHLLKVHSAAHDLLTNDMVRESFKANEWVIRKVGSSLMLLVPQEIIRNLGFTLENARSAASSPELTALEWKLGLKINHMDESLDEKSLDSFLKSYQKPNTRDYFINALWNKVGEEALSDIAKKEQKKLFAEIEDARKKVTAKDTTEQDRKDAQQREIKAREALAAHMKAHRLVGNSSIFVTNAEYATRTPTAQEQQPQWTIYLAGHGELGITIAFLSIPDFRSTIDFFEKDVITQFLFLKSCYTGGTNVSLAYKNIDEQQPKSLSFPIAMLASYDVSTIGYYPYFILDSNRLTLRTSNDFDALSTTINNPEYKNNPYDVALVIQALFPSLYRLDPNMPDYGISNNFPQVRPAKRDIFIPLFPGFILGKVVITTRNTTKQSLNVVETIQGRGAQWNTLYLVLEAEAPKIGVIAKQDISFPLIINKYSPQQKLPVILSSVSEGTYTVIHRIEELITDTEHKTLIQNLMDPLYKLRRIFWIKKFSASDGTYGNVIIDIKGKDVKTYITESNGQKIVYTDFIYKAVPTPVSSDYTKSYDALWKSNVQTIAEAQKILDVDPQKELIAALESGNIVQAQHALAMGADPNGNIDGTPFLFHNRAYNSNQKNAAEIAQLLITAVKKKAGEETARKYVEQRNADNKTPLIVASQEGNVPLIRVLLANGASVDKADKDNYTALEWAIWYSDRGNNYKEAVVVLLNAGADANKGLKYAQSRVELHPKEYTPIVELIEKWQADKRAAQPQAPVVQLQQSTQSREPRPPSYPKPVQQPTEAQKILDIDPQKELIAALESGNIVQAQHALAMGADPYGIWDDAPLLYAIASVTHDLENEAEIAQLLITAVKKKAGEETARKYIEQRNADNKTPLIVASQEGNVPLIRVLLANGASVDEVDTDNYTALEWAIWYSDRGNNYKEAVVVLLNAGADANKGLEYAQWQAGLHPKEYAPIVELIEKWLADKRAAQPQAPVVQLQQPT